MYVIQGTATQANARILLGDATLTGSQTVTVPADRVAYTYGTNNANSGAYQIASAAVMVGNAAPIQLTNPSLGFIGKSGRFVEIAG